MIYLDTSLVYKYLDSLNINDLTLPNSTWLYLDRANSAEHLLLGEDVYFCNSLEWNRKLHLLATMASLPQFGTEEQLP